jgi:hypothetical protein
LFYRNEKCHNLKLKGQLLFHPKSAWERKNASIKRIFFKANKQENLGSLHIKFPKQKSTFATQG